MSFKFGVGSLSLLRNLEINGATVTSGSSGVPAQNATISSGLVMIDGITAVVSGQSAAYTAAGATGTGLLVYLIIPAGNTITATAMFMTAADPANTASNLPTGICPLARFSFGTGANSISTIIKWSGGSATKTIAKVQSWQYSVTYEQAQMRGGGDIFPVDTQFMNGAIEGSFQFSDMTSSHNLFLGGIYDSAGASSGTWTLSAVSKPEAVCVAFQNITDGVTSTYTIPKCYITSAENNNNRTEYLQPTFNFIGQANNLGTVMKIEG